MSSPPLWRVGLLIGLATGVFSGLLGIGGAAILIPGMVELMGLRQHRAHGTSLLVMVPAAALSAVVYTLSHPLDWGLVALFSAASMVGAVIGARLMMRLPAPTLKRLFGVFLLVVAIRMLIS
ncbi:MAG: sulfite exporter TauE/SafE family protein [Chloroflexi bacterium]|nr:sulfite exporter TauE/SafE family protein [Chloroflexota bacterium]